MAENLRIEESKEADVPRLIEIFIPAFSFLKWMQIVGYTSDAAGHQLAEQTYLAAWKEHNPKSSLPFSIKCIHTSPTTGQGTLITQANWAIYSHSRPELEFTRPHALIRADWVQDSENRTQAQRWIETAHRRRIRWFGGTPHGELYFMCTDAAFERMGAATLCVKWGLEKCKELGIPAWLEASEAGMKMYERLGFEVVKGEETGEGRGAPMVWWPEGWREEDKKPVLPGWDGEVRFD